MSPYRALRRQVGRVLRTIPYFRRQLEASCDYHLLNETGARAAQAGGWFAAATARRQEKAYMVLLAGMREGDPRIDLTVAARAVDALELPRARLLEVGCGGGYYSEIFRTLARMPIDYTGLDYSPAMVTRARTLYPGARFVQGDATSLDFPDAAFDIVFNGVSLMHILDYEKAIAESRRVARRACIFHSVPVIRGRPTAFVGKYAYGSPVVEVIFNRDALLSLFDRHCLRLRESWITIPYDVGHVLGETSQAETFLCTVAP